MKKMVAGALAGGAAMLASAGAFAQASGAAIDDTSLVSTISSTSTTVQDVGMAVLGVVVVVFAFRLIKGFIGR